MRRGSLRPYVLLALLVLALFYLPFSWTSAMRAKVASCFSWTERFYIVKQLPCSHDTEILLLQQRIASLEASLNQTASVRCLPQNHTLHGAKVIFRDPNTWSSSVWIDIGHKDTPIVKNDAVVVGCNLVGVVEEVAEHSARVRLLTDCGLSVSVRVARPTGTAATDYLAKGEIRGSSAVSLGKALPILKGRGFNYDTEDKYGPAQDLRSYSGSRPLLAASDLLVTSGLDALFPEGLHVAKISRIEPLKEGAFYYDLEAIPTQDRLHELTHVFVLHRERKLVANTESV